MLLSINKNTFFLLIIIPNFCNTLFQHDIERHKLSLKAAKLMHLPICPLYYIYLSPLISLICLLFDIFAF